MFLAKSRATFAKASKGALIDGYADHDTGRRGRGLRVLKKLAGYALFVWAVSATYMLARLRSKYHTEIAELFPPALSENDMIHDLIMRDPELILVGKDSVTARKVSQVDFAVGSLEARDAGDRAALAELERCPRGTEGSQIRMLIVVTSTCCSIGSRRKRQAIRDTWVRDGLRKWGEVVSVKFLLSTPRVNSEAEAKGLRKLLREEIAAVGYNDLVLLNNALETYDNLPLKTIEIMRYLKLSTCGFSHVLKTDDDVYARVTGVLALAGYQPANWHIAFDKRPTEQLEKVRVPEMRLAGRETTRPAAAGPARLPRDRAARAFLLVRPAHALLLLLLRPPQVYRGFIGDKRGFHANRDKASKWYLSPEEWPLDTRHVPYASGWGYLLSRDTAVYIVDRMDHYKSIADGGPGTMAGSDGRVPPYYRGLLKLEDVMVGYLLSEIGVAPWNTDSFKAGHVECHMNTILKHLDIDAPFLLPVLSVTEKSGLWNRRTVQCNSGDSIGTFAKYLNFSLKNKPERVRKVETLEPLVREVSYSMYPLVDDTELR